MTDPKLNVTIIGAGGLVGGELLRLLSEHPAVGKIRALSRSRAGQKLSDVHPVLRHKTMDVFHNIPLSDALDGVDVCFVATPHGQSNRFMPSVIANENLRVIDLSADFRLKNRDSYKKYYGDHECFELAEKFNYGLPELQREAIGKSRLVANPGCFATAAELLLLPLAAQGLLPEDVPVFAVTGSSGSGITPKEGTHHPFRDGNFYAYKMLNHQHESEIGETLAIAARQELAPRLLSHSGPFVRGIHASTFIKDSRFSEADVHALYASYYSSHPFTHVLNSPPKMAEVVATNFAHLHVTQQDDSIEIAIAIDNLVKGAAGQAIQNMNLMLGLPEQAGLTYGGAFPC